MIRNPSSVGAVSLVLLVVLSIAVGGVAEAAGAAADASTTASVADAVEYDGSVELALDSGTGSPIQASNVRVWVDGVDRSDGVTVVFDGTDGRLVLSGLEDVPPTDSLVVDVDQSGDLQTGNVSVTVTGDAIRAGRSVGSYRGTPVAYVASGTDVGVDLYEDGEFQARRGTGANSRVYVFPTADDPPGTTYRLEETSGGDATTRLELRDLGLTAEVDATSITEDESVTVSVSSRDANRPLVLEVVDLERDAVDRTVDGSIDGDGSASVTLADLSEGRYRVRVIDANSGLATTTAEVTVGSGVEGTVEFASKTVTDQRGDVVDVPVAFTGETAGGRARISLSDMDGTFRATLTVEDADGDGEVVVHWNTADSANDSAGLWISGGDVVEGPTVDEPVSEPVEPAEYSLSAARGGTTTDVATVFVEERSTTAVAVLTAPASVDGWDGPQTVREDATPSDTVALDTKVRRHDWVVLRANASGLEGYVESAADVAGSNGLSLSIRQTEETAGANQELLEVDASETTLMAAGDDDTYYVAFVPELHVRDAEPGDEFEVTLSVDADENPVSSTDETVTSSFTFVEGSAEFDTRDGEVVAPNEAGAGVTGTSTFAPGTSLTVELRSEGGTSPFVVDREVTVGPGGRWDASFDLSDRPDDQTYTAKVGKAGEVRTTADGRVGTVAGSSTSTAVESPTDPETTATSTADETDSPTDADTSVDDTGSTPTPTPTTAPGFGTLLAVATLLAAVVLLRRRD